MKSDAMPSATKPLASAAYVFLLVLAGVVGVALGNIVAAYLSTHAGSQHELSAQVMRMDRAERIYDAQRAKGDSDLRDLQGICKNSELKRASSSALVLLCVEGRWTTPSGVK
jgi:hypothetical protein